MISDGRASVREVRREGDRLFHVEPAAPTAPQTPAPPRPRPRTDVVARVQAVAIPPPRVTTSQPVDLPWSPTCAVCGKKDSIWPLRAELDGFRYPACAGCWRMAREVVPTPVSPQSEDARAERAASFDAEVLAALRRVGPLTVRELAVELNLVGEVAERHGRGVAHHARDRVRNALRRLEAARRVARRRKSGRVRFAAR